MVKKNKKRSTLSFCFTIQRELPALAQKVGTGHKFYAAKLSNMRVIPSAAVLDYNMSTGFNKSYYWIIFTLLYFVFLLTL